MEIYTDGACSPNPGPGGWGAILRYGDRERELYGGDAGPTTNNRMELTAPIRALSVLTRPSKVRVFTDSTYVRDGITAWLPKWQANGWLTKKKEPVKNADLWKELAAACARHDVDWQWVKGHAGHPDNERADRLAVRGAVEAGGSAQQPRKPVERPATQQRSHGGRALCRATTRAGGPCRAVARLSGLCHLHDPELQCGAITRKGRPCTIATGGGRCRTHWDVEEYGSGGAKAEYGLLDI